MPGDLSLLTAGLSAAFGRPVQFSDDVKTQGLLQAHAIGLAQVSTQRKPKEGFWPRCVTVKLKISKVHAVAGFSSKALSSLKPSRACQRWRKSRSFSLSSRRKCQSVAMAEKMSHSGTSKRMPCLARFRKYCMVHISLSGKTFSIGIKSLDRTVQDLKKSIFKKKGIPVSQQILSNQGRKIENWETLRHANVMKRSTLLLELEGHKWDSLQSTSDTESGVIRQTEALEGIEDGTRPRRFSLSDSGHEGKEVQDGQ